MPSQRQRYDGTWTYTSEEWDEKWYFTTGLRVRLNNNVSPARLRGMIGYVEKVNNVTIDVLLSDGTKIRRVPMPSVTKLT